MMSATLNLCKSIAGYSQLPIKKKTLMENGEFLMTINIRTGCPLTEKQLKIELINCHRKLLRECCDDVMERKSAIETLKELDNRKIGELLFYQVRKFESSSDTK